MFGLAAIPSVIQFVGFLFMPETPRWLITKGHLDKARMVLHRIHGTSVDVEQEITDISNSVQQGAENRKLICVHKVLCDILYVLLLKKTYRRHSSRYHLCE